MVETHTQVSTKRIYSAATRIWHFLLHWKVMLSFIPCSNSAVMLAFYFLLSSLAFNYMDFNFLTISLSSAPLEWFHLFPSTLFPAFCRSSLQLCNPFLQLIALGILIKENICCWAVTFQTSHDFNGKQSDSVPLSVINSQLQIKNASQTTFSILFSVSVSLYESNSLPHIL